MRAVRHEFKKVMVVYQQGLLISPQIKIPILPGTETGQHDACVGHSDPTAPSSCNENVTESQSAAHIDYSTHKTSMDILKLCTNTHKSGKTPQKHV